MQTLNDAGAGEIIDAGLAVRNTLAHRSRQSVRNMNERVQLFPAYPMLRKKTMSSDGIGTYLVARTIAGLLPACPQSGCGALATGTGRAT